MLRKQFQQVAGKLTFLTSFLLSKSRGWTKMNKRGAAQVHGITMKIPKYNIGKACDEKLAANRKMFRCSKGLSVD